MKRITLSFFAVLCAITLQAQEQGIVRYVREGGTGKGTSWEDATGSIQRAVNAVAAFGRGEVRVAGGKYAEMVKIMGSDIRLIGSIDPATNEQSTKTNLSRIQIMNQPCGIYVAYFQRNIVVDGFAVVRGGADKPFDYDSDISMASGGISIHSAGTVIRNCSVIGYKTGEWGIDMDVARVLLENCYVSGCNSGIKTYGECELRQVVVSGNDQYGITTHGSTLTGCTVETNGTCGIWMEGCQLYQCIVRNNYPRDRYADGGGVVITGGDRNILHGCLIYNNTATRGAGVLTNTKCYIESCVIANNLSTSGYAGVDMQFNNADLYIAGSIIWNNRTQGQNTAVNMQDANLKAHGCAIEGGTLVPELDEINGVIDLPAKNIDPQKPSVRFKKVSGIVGAVVNDKEKQKQILQQDFRLTAGSACIGTGQLIPEKYTPYLEIDRSALMDGTPVSPLNMGAYANVAE